MLVWNDFCHDARVLKEAQTLQAAGYQVTVHAVQAPGRTLRDETLGDGIRVRRAAWLPRRGAHRTGFVVRQLMARMTWFVVVFFRILLSRPDVVHGHDVNTLHVAWLAARLSRARLVYDAHEISTHREGYQRVRALVARTEVRLLPSCDGVITTTEARARFFARAYSVARPLVLQNRPRYQPVVASGRIRKELGLQQPWPIVLYQGGLQPGRGLGRLVKAAAQVPDTYFVFIGSGTLTGSLHELVRHLQLQERVHFIPAVPLEVLPHYTAAADIGVQPIENTCLNHFTTDSNKLFEYIQAGLPVIASDLPEIRQILNKHQLGLLVRPGDTGALVQALLRLTSDTRLRAHYAAQSQLAAPRLSWEQQEHLLLGLYRHVLQGRSGLATPP